MSASGGGGGGSPPGGAANAVQFNSAGSFGGTAVVNNAVLVTNSSGVPSESATLPSGLTIPGYLTGNQTITLTGDATGSGATSINTTLATVNTSPGTYRNATVTVHTKGRSTTVTAAVPFGTPASSRAACTQGDSLFDATYIYTCVATNTWHRVANGATW